MMIRRIHRLVLFALIAALTAGCANNDGWQTTRRDSANIAPVAKDTPEPVLMVFGADVYGWRGHFAIHTWIAAKPENADQYTVYEVRGWGVRHGRPALRIVKDVPDRFWYGAEPQVLYENRGAEAGVLIEQIAEAAQRYPWADEYRLFPGPNSNTFPAWVADQVPGFDLDLPLSAIGQSWHR